jgi:Flp pilus assembly protein TadD
LERAASQDQDWFFFYQAYLQKLGMVSRLHDFWKRQVTRPEIESGQRRSIAFQLLEVGYKEEAEKAFRVLAELAPPDSPDVNQLLHLWGPKPTEVCLDWLEVRAREAKKDVEVVGWMAHLSNLNEFPRVVRVVEEKDLLRDDPNLGLVQAYLLALAQLDDDQKLERVIKEQIQRCRSPKGLEALANLTLECSREDLAVEAYRKLLDKKPEDAQAHKVIGRQAFYRGSKKLARQHLEESIRIDPEDSEILFYLGEILRTEGERSAGDSSYQKALASLQEQGPRTFEDRLLEAKLLNRVGETEKCLEMFRGLVKEKPNDRYLRGDFASVLIENKRYEEAEAVLRLEKSDG